jgi:hypothetical protein
MGLNAIQYEVYQPPLNLDIVRGITPVKTEPEVLRSISELISMQILTQQLLSQLATAQMGRFQAGQAFIRQGQRAEEGAAFDNSAEQVRLLSQRVEELERRLEESTGRKAAATAK